MKRAAIALRKAQGAFLILHMHEMEVLRSLPSWMVSLFTALLQHADHATGHGQVSYAVLASMLAPIQPRSGPRLFAPDIQAIKKAVRQLEARLMGKLREHLRQNFGDAVGVGGAVGVGSNS